MEANSASVALLRMAAAMLWAGHVAVWLLAGLSARLSRTGVQIEKHVKGLVGAEVAPDHLRHILTAPTTEFKAISLAGVVAALVLALIMRRSSPAGLRRVTSFITSVSLVVYFLGYVY